MTTAYTPTAQIATSNPATHADGDDGNATNFNRPLEPLLDARAFVRSLAPGMLLWRGMAAVDAGGTSSSFTLRFSPIEAVVLPDGSGTLYVFESTAAEQTIGLSKVEGSPASLTGNTFYYVYCVRSSGGSLDFEVSTTAPDAFLTFKNGAQTKRYLFCFRTDSSGVPIPMRCHRGRYVYRKSALANNQTRVLNTTTEQASATDLSLAALVPPHSRLATIISQLSVSGSSGEDGLAQFYTNGDTSDSQLRHDAEAESTTTREVEIETDSSQVLDYTFAISGSGTGTLTVWVGGFSE